MAEIQWVSKEDEKNVPKPPTLEERLEAAEAALISLLLEETYEGGAL